MGKVLLYIGGFLILLGLLILFGGKFLPFGRLPGDIHWEGTHGTLYVPAGTCILLSRWVTFIVRIAGEGLAVKTIIAKPFHLWYNKNRI